MIQIFNETEKMAIATVIIKLLAADRKFDKNELQFMHHLFVNYDIPLVIPEDQRVRYDQALEVISAMPTDRKSVLHSILQQLADSDTDSDDNELQLIRNVIGK